MKRELKRIDDGKNEMLAGVCAGIAYSLGVPVFLVRLFWVLFGITFSVYLLLWILLPKWDKTPKDFEKITGG